MPFLVLLSYVYRYVMQCRLWMYRHQWLSTNTLPCRVLSVGNLTVGGTGKTPVVIWLARRLQAKGHRVGILSRGYGRNNSSPYLMISDGSQVFLGPNEAGDEPFFLAQSLPGVVVAVGANRYEVGKKVLQQYPIDWFILDDGFQHVKLFRDEDFLLVDASNLHPVQRLLPAGQWREPLSAGRRATEVIVTRVKDVRQADSVVKTMEQAIQNTIRPVVTRFVVTSLKEILSQQSVSPRHMVGKTAVVFCGIGNPESFQASLTECRIQVVHTCVFADHYSYQLSDWLAIKAKATERGADIIVTTEKDAVKLQPVLQDNEPLWVVQLSVDVVSGGERLERIFEFSGA